MAGVNLINLHDVFTYHAPENEAQLAGYKTIREMGEQ